MKKSQYSFYLNPHDYYKWTKCPKCDTKTKVRKFCLVIHYDEKPKKASWKNIFKKRYVQLMSLNKSCKFCTNCELIIGQKPDLDPLISNIVAQAKIEFNPDNYLVMGTMDKKLWLKGQKEPLDPVKILTLINPFKDVLDFEIRPAGWYFDDEI